MPFGIDIPNPLDHIPNPMDWLGGSDRGSVPQGPQRFEEQRQERQGQQEPASIRDRYRQRAFEQIGAENEQEFQSMDPRQRNTRITGAYADMYMSDSDTNKWAGMAAYASDLVGVGIAGTQVAGGVPFLPEGMDMAGIDNAKLQELLAEGNAGVYDDLMWQHMAMQEGGIDMMRQAAEAGEIPPEQLAGWETIAAGRAALDEARASGDQRAIDAANNQIWSGNNALLQYEQQVFLQNLVYDESPEARALFEQISPGMISPIPGGTSFLNHRDAQGQGLGGADIGDRDQRWDWINNSMAPEYRNREENQHDSMLRDMRRFSANADTGLPGMPVNTEDPLDFELPEMPDIPGLPWLQRQIENIPNPLDLLPNIPNPLDHLPNIPNPLDHLPNIPNPLDHLPNIPNPLDHLPNIPNPLDHLPSMPSIPNPLDHLPSLPNIPMPSMPRMPDISLPNIEMPSLPSMRDVRRSLPFGLGG